MQQVNLFVQNLMEASVASHQDSISPKHTGISKKSLVGRFLRVLKYLRRSGLLEERSKLSRLESSLRKKIN